MESQAVSASTPFLLFPLGLPLVLAFWGGKEEPGKEEAKPVEGAEKERGESRWLLARALLRSKHSLNPGGQRVGVARDGSSTAQGSLSRQAVTTFLTPSPPRPPIT